MTRNRKMPTGFSPTVDKKRRRLRWHQSTPYSLFLLTLTVAIGMSWLAVTIQ